MWVNECFFLVQAELGRSVWRAIKQVIIVVTACTSNPTDVICSSQVTQPRYLSYHLSLDITCSYPGHIAKFTCAITGDIDITYAIRSNLTQGSYSSSLNQILRLFQSITQYSLQYSFQ